MELRLSDGHTHRHRVGDSVVESARVDAGRVMTGGQPDDALT